MHISVLLGEFKLTSSGADFDVYSERSSQHAFPVSHISAEIMSLAFSQVNHVAIYRDRHFESHVCAYIPAQNDRNKRTSLYVDLTAELQFVNSDRSLGKRRRRHRATRSPFTG
jgi:hypothetical protein